MDDFAEKVLLYRKRNKMDQTTLSELLGVTRQTIGNYENGKTTPDTEPYTKFMKLIEGE